MWRLLLNGTLFNISWLAIVYSQSLVIALGVVFAHLALHAAVFVENHREWFLIGAVAVFGLLLDQLLFAAGVFTLLGHPALAPLWLSCLWPVLATTFGHAFAALQFRPLLAAAAGAIGGTFSYIAGTKISEVDFGSGLYGPVIMGVLWMLLMPVLARFAGMTLNGEGDRRVPA